MIIDGLSGHRLPRRTGTTGRFGFPRQCPLCRGWTAQPLCADCLQRFAAPAPRCGRCARRLGVALPACADCLRQPLPFERCLCAGDYAFPWDRLIADFKFRGRIELAPALAAALLAALSAAPGPAVDLVLPVPLSDARLAERGHHQAWEIARRIARARGVAADAATLRRLRDTPHQVGLSRRERDANLRDAMWIEPARAAALAGRRIALVDDVMTTGATAAAAAEVLLRAGAAAVDLWVIARTPDPGD
ncbi:ComF family protein [Aquabacterium humicola]|uniref:ComF family protein n=1 Tax=Aquabacterium humicola TaxID=3237377 RepID=UPI002543C016|nr:ComF family protein [Rubrivivax pictus]